jgi:hypothetical protein
MGGALETTCRGGKWALVTACIHSTLHNMRIFMVIKKLKLDVENEKKLSSPELPVKMDPTWRNSCWTSAMKYMGWFGMPVRSTHPANMYISGKGISRR